MKTTDIEITIRDLNGYQQPIENIDASIGVAAEHIEWYVENKDTTEHGKKQQAYWTDIHEKLTAIKNKLKNENRKNVKYS